MRDLLVFAIVFALLPYAFKRPAVGAMLFAWIGLMNPHRLCYGAAHDFPFSALIAGVTVIGMFFGSQPKRLPLRPTILMLFLLILWTTFTSFFALEPELVWVVWDRVIKIFFMVLVSIAVLNSERDIKEFTWVVALSIGFYGLKGGIFTLVSGGGSHVFGPPGSNIADNNDLALALVTTLPLIWYLYLQANARWLRYGLIGLSLLCVVATVGTYSRGALVGGLAMLTLLWLKNRNKVAIGLVFVLIVGAVFAFMPEQWFARMGTIDTNNLDASALGRINAWYFAVNVVKHNFLGGGFTVFTPRMFLIYAPEPHNYHAAHSIYFQVLGEQGPVGLIIFLLLMGFAWFTGTRVLKFTKNRKDLKWANDLAAMCQVSILGYAAGGAFLSLAYFDLYYDVIALLVVLEKFVFLIPDKAKEKVLSVPTQQISENQGPAI